MDGSAPLIGYFAKAATRGGDWVKLPGTEEICSVSTCIAAGPEGWIERWQHNAMWLYPSEGAARSSIGDEDASRFDIFAYRIEPIGFDREGCSQPLAEAASGIIIEAQNTTEPMPPDFEFLGYDCVAADIGGSFAGFGCSPLSCNGMAREIAVNRHCLIDDRERAIETAGRFEKERPEPGPYYVIGVWRKRRPLEPAS